MYSLPRAWHKWACGRRVSYKGRIGGGQEDEELDSRPIKDANPRIHRVVLLLRRAHDGLQAEAIQGRSGSIHRRGADGVSGHLGGVVGEGAREEWNDGCTGDPPVDRAR